MVRQQILKLKQLTTDAKKRRADEDSKRHEEILQAELKDADRVIAKIPDSVKSAANAGRDSAQILRLSSADMYYSRNEKQPALDAAQQKVFDALKEQGLDPSIKRVL